MRLPGSLAGILAEASHGSSTHAQNPPIARKVSPVCGRHFLQAWTSGSCCRVLGLHQGNGLAGGFWAAPFPFIDTHHHCARLQGPLGSLILCAASVERPSLPVCSGPCVSVDSRGQWCIVQAPDQLSPALPAEKKTDPTLSLIGS